MIKILVLNGPNINLLGTREPEIYGSSGYDTLCEAVNLEAKKLDIKVDIMQNNIEGELVTILQKADDAFDGVVFNPAAYTHYSIALFDAVKAISIPVAEVHLSNIYARAKFRHKIVIAPACIGQICGFGIDSYLLGIRAVLKYLSR